MTQAEEAAIETRTASSVDASPPLAIDPRTVLESMGDAFYALDHAWQVVYANRRALAFWNMPAEEIVGRILWDALPQLTGTLE